MRINRITLYNFGSYEGEIEFDTEVKNKKNIILIGGKNGAGKTTLFTAIRLCLYGHLSMGYKSINYHYNRSVIKLINNRAKEKKPADAFVQLNLTIANGQTLDYYYLRRSWELNESLKETFTVKKNEHELSDSELADFEKYILSIVPPDLFNLFFFDGEKIADFFMNEGGNTRIKNAVLTLCGYDTFEIIRKNFKRVHSEEKSVPIIDDYLVAKEAYEKSAEEMALIETSISECKIKIESTNSEIIFLDKDYAKKGGITQEEWNQKQFILKEEDKKREKWNSLIKKWANEVIPFLMVRPQIVSLYNQIVSENKFLKYRYFCDVLDSASISNMLQANNLSVSAIKDEARKVYAENETQILDLSFEQSSNLLAQVDSIIHFDEDNIKKCKQAIKRSLTKTAKIRAELDNTSIVSVQEYMEKRSSLIEKSNSLLSQLMYLEKEAKGKEEEVKKKESDYKKAKLLIEAQLKSASINDIASKSIMMLDHLQSILYARQIKKIENCFKGTIQALMRKTNFIDDIRIDNKFNVRIYRSETIPLSRIKMAVESNTEKQLVSLFGSVAVELLKSKSAAGDLEHAVQKMEENGAVECVLPVEIDKTSLSNGEKQIFIMAFYFSLIQLCKYEIPFVIDTPFARIDTEHRNNISKYFFGKLNGQVFVLSTDEEISAAHIDLLHEKIMATYMLENTDEKRTTVYKNVYFEGD